MGHGYRVGQVKMFYIPHTHNKPLPTVCVCVCTDSPKLFHLAGSMGTPSVFLGKNPALTLSLTPVGVSLEGTVKYEFG